MTAGGFDGDGVRLISPADEGFSALVDALAAPGWAQRIKEAAPSVVIVANDSDRRIVALSTRFSVEGGAHHGTSTVFFVAPDAIAATDLDYGRASSKGIAPGEQRMIGFGFEVPDRTYPGKSTPEEREFYDPQVHNWIQARASELASARSVHVTLDAAIFADGGLLGDDTSDLVPHFDALVRARRGAYQAVLDRIDAGERAGDAVKRFMRPEVPGEPDSITREWHAANEARHTVAALLRHYGRTALRDVLQRAIPPQPFVIRKRT